MQNNLTLQFRYTSTGIEVEAVNASGATVASREIGKMHMQHWVANHADRNAAIEFDAEISEAIRRDEDAQGNLAGIFDGIDVLIKVCSGLDNVA